MSSIGVQIQKRKKGRYVSIIECFTDPVTGKRTSRTIKPFGYVEKDLEEDPDFMAKVYAECDQLRVDRAEAKRLRERQDMRLRPEREAYGSARLCIYGDAVLCRVWTELGLPGFFRASCCRSALGFDLDLHAFCAAASMILPPGDAVDSGVIVPQFLLDYGEVRAEHGPAMLTCLAGLRGRLEAFLAERVPDLAAFDPDDQEEAGPRETMCILPGLRAVRLETGTERRGFAVVRLLAEATPHPETTPRRGRRHPVRRFRSSSDGADTLAPSERGPRGAALFQDRPRLRSGTPFDRSRAHGRRQRSRPVDGGFRRGTDEDA